MSKSRNVVHTPSGTGKAFWGPGDMYTFLITGEQTEGAYFMLEAFVPQGGGAPPHIHHDEDETLYILAGECSMHIGDENLTARAGDLIDIPKGTIHAFRNEQAAPLRMIAIFVPAGTMEKFFEEVLKPVTDRSAAPPPPTQEMIDRMIAVAPKYGLEIVQPTD